MSGYARRSALMERWKKNIPESLQQKYDFYNYNYAVEILTQAFPEEWDELVNCLESFKLSINDLTEAGGAETKIPGKIDSTLYPEGWRNVKIKGDLHIDFFERKIDQKQYDDEASQERIVYRFIDGHHIDYYKPGVGIQLEWKTLDYEVSFNADDSVEAYDFDDSREDSERTFNRQDSAAAILEWLTKGDSNA